MGDLRRDPIVLLAAAVYALVAVVCLLLALPVRLRATLTSWADVVLLGLALAQSWRTFRDERAAGGRRFWGLVTASLGTWFVVVLLSAAGGAERWGSGFSVLTDGLFLVYYLGLILATTRKPDDLPRRAELSAILVTEVAGACILACGLLAYFIVLPSRLTPGAYATFVPSLTLFVLLDSALLGRLAWWARGTPGGRWHRVYLALAISLACTLLHDAHELATYTRGESLAPSPWDLVWWAQFVTLAIAARAARPHEGERPASPDQPRETGATARRQALGAVVPFAFVLPGVHLAGRLLGGFDPALDTSRETLVLASVMVLGGLAVIHQVLLDRRFRIVRGHLRDAQGQLQQARKMEALGRLAGGIAHDFNNLLSVILGYSEVLQGRCTPGDRIAGPVEQIRQAAERAATLTRQLTVFSRGQLTQQQVVELDRAVEAVVPLLRRLVGDRVTVVVTPGVPGGLVNVDPFQFERALINLAANAGEAMPDGGTLAVRTSAVDLREDGPKRIGALPAGAYLVVELSDTGTGMTADVRAHLFEPFFTTRPRDRHRGLGLSLVYGIMSRLGGHIDVASVPGQGTTVRLYCPRHAEERPAGAEAPASAPTGEGLTVLLAEDEDDLRDLMRSFLEEAGFVVLDAADGRAALDLATQYPGRIDALVSDVVMPGIDGKELARRLGTERPEMRVLFVSGYTPDLLDGLEMAIAPPDLMQKPFTMQELVARVREVVAGGRRAPAGDAVAGRKADTP
jgi:two-component system, cell cycle sensor histidine kinase and response regulator CckA